MNMINDGGPAFPTYASDHRGAACNTTFEPKGGMALRDIFAAKAMAALIAEPVGEGWTGTAVHWTKQLQMNTQMSGPDIFAHAAYMMADAMLKAREVSYDNRD